MCLQDSRSYHKSSLLGIDMRERQVIGVGRTAEILAWDDDQVLKLFRNDWSFSAVKWEEKVARTVSEAGVPVPAVHGIIEVEGRHGILYNRVDGPSMLKELMSLKSGKLEHFAGLFAKLHANMHSVRVEELPSQHQRLKEKIRNAKPLAKDLKQAALEALNKLPTDNMLCHGDFHPDNILMSPQGPIIIDWTDATKGMPEADIARTLMLLQKGQPPLAVHRIISRVAELLLKVRTRFTRAYLRRYRTIRSISIEDVKSWQLPVMAARLSEGIKEEESDLLSTLKTMVQHQRN